MFGYAPDETEVLMPAPSSCPPPGRAPGGGPPNGILPLLRPDAKSQVNLHYITASRFRSMVVLSVQHAAGDRGRRTTIIKPIPTRPGC